LSTKEVCYAEEDTERLNTKKLVPVEEERGGFSLIRGKGRAPPPIPSFNGGREMIRRRKKEEGQIQ